MVGSSQRAACPQDQANYPKPQAERWHGLSSLCQSILSPEDSILACGSFFKLIFTQNPEPKTQNLKKGQGRGADLSGAAPIQQAEVQGGPPLVMRYPGAQGHVQGAVQGVVGGLIKGDGLQDVAAALGQLHLQMPLVYHPGAQALHPQADDHRGRVAGAEGPQGLQVTVKGAVQVGQLNLGVDFEGGPGRLKAHLLEEGLLQEVL